MRTVLAVIAIAFLAGGLLAQPMPVAPPLPPPAPLPPGQVVSHPLTAHRWRSRPARWERCLATASAGWTGPRAACTSSTCGCERPCARSGYGSEAKALPPERPLGPLGPSWEDYQLLYFWPMRQPVPALAYGNRSGLPPIPGQNDTRLLLGGQSLGSQPSAGGRFTLGASIDKEETLGWEATYFFLGTRTFSQNARTFAGGSVESIGLPYTNATTGMSDILTVAQPGVSNSMLTVSTSVRVQGWEVTGVANVVDDKHVRVNALFGWRYFQVQEGLRLEQTQFRYTPDGGLFRTADQFDAHNRFNGGQLGFHTDMRRGLVFCEMTGKIAFGQNYEVVKNEGMTILQGPTRGVQAFGGSGIYVQPSNAGRTANGVFAVLPEGTVKFGLHLGDSGRIYVGYSFLYLSDAVRPGDQIDRTLNPSQVPLVSGNGPVYGALSPARIVNRSDFWVQGLVIGLETRY